MTENEKYLRGRVVRLALEWRECDESEPIPSGEADKKMTRLVFAIDDLKHCLDNSENLRKVYEDAMNH